MSLVASTVPLMVHVFTHFHDFVLGLKTLNPLFTRQIRTLNPREGTYRCKLNSTFLDTNPDGMPHLLHRERQIQNSLY